MQLEVRVASPDDVPLLLEICRHPQVQPHQYKLSSTFEDSFRRQIGGDRFLRGVEHCHATIEFQQAVVGYIIHCHFCFREHRIAMLGWNLHPDYWGQGIMPASVSILMDRCAIQHETRFFIADCFRQNTRCKRVLAKLGFKKIYIPWFARAIIAANQRCLHWIERFQFDYANRP